MRHGHRHRQHGLALDHVRAQEAVEAAGAGRREGGAHELLRLERRDGGHAPVADQHLRALAARHGEERCDLLGALGARDDLHALALEVRLELRRHHAAIPRAEAQRAHRAAAVQRPEAVRHLGERVVGHRVVRLPGVAVEAGERREDDQVAEGGTLLGGERGEQVGEPGDLDAEDGVEVGLALVLDHLVLDDARRVHDARDRQAVLLLRRAHRRAHLLGVARVARQVDGAAAALLDQRHRLVHVADAAHLARRVVEQARRGLRAAPRGELRLQVGERRLLEGLAGVGDARRPCWLGAERRAPDQQVSAAADAAGERGDAQRGDAARATGDEQHVILRHLGAAGGVALHIEQLARAGRVPLAARVVAHLAQRQVGARDLAHHCCRRRGGRERLGQVDAAAEDVVPLEAERLAQPEGRAPLRLEHAGQRVGGGREAAGAGVLHAQPALVAHARDGQEEAAADALRARRRRRLQVRLEVLGRHQCPAQLRVLVGGARILLRVRVHEAGGRAVLLDHPRNRGLERLLRAVRHLDAGRRRRQGREERLACAEREHDDAAALQGEQLRRELRRERRAVVHEEQWPVGSERQCNGCGRGDRLGRRVGQGDLVGSGERVAGRSVRPQSGGAAVGPRSRHGRCRPRAGRRLRGATAAAALRHAQGPLCLGELGRRSGSLALGGRRLRLGGVDLALGRLELGICRADAGDHLTGDLVAVVHDRLQRLLRARRDERAGLQAHRRHPRRRLLRHARPAELEWVGHSPRVEVSERHAEDGELCRGLAQLEVGRLVLGGVDGNDAQVVGRRQNLPDELGERGARTELDEDARAVTVHRAHLLDPLDGARHVLAEHVDRGGAAAGVRGLARDVRVELRAGRRLEGALRRAQLRVEGVARRLHQRRVEGAAHLPRR